MAESYHLGLPRSLLVFFLPANLENNYCVFCLTMSSGNESNEHNTFPSPIQGAPDQLG